MNLLKFTWVYLSLLEFTGIYLNLREFTWIRGLKKNAPLIEWLFASKKTEQKEKKFKERKDERYEDR